MAGAEVLLHPDAANEHAEAFAWDAERSEVVARRVEAEVELALALVREAPGCWPSYDSKHRKLVLRRFPFLLIYREVEERIWVVAVAHGYRRPGHWPSRRVGPL